MMMYVHVGDEVVSIFKSLELFYSTLAENIWKMSFIGVVYNKKLLTI